MARILATTPNHMMYARRIWEHGGNPIFCAPGCTCMDCKRDMNMSNQLPMTFCGEKFVSGFRQHGPFLAEYCDVERWFTRD